MPSNRIIKFRGKRTDNGEWAYGDLTRYSEVEAYITVDLIENEVHSVDAKTVGQMTGLTDRNGTDIYEGDIVECVYEGQANDFFEVVFREGQFIRDSRNLTLATELHSYGGKVIGNIYENGDLLA